MSDIVVGSKWNEKDENNIVTVVQLWKDEIVFEEASGKRDRIARSAFLKYFEPVQESNG